MPIFLGRRYRHLRHLVVRRGRQLTTIDPIPAPYLPLLLRIVGPLYRRFGMRVSRITVDGIEKLTEVLQDHDHKTVFAFRHPSGDDPLIVFRVLQRLLRTANRGPGKLPIFLYGRDVPIWAGPVAAWLLPRIGGISVFHEQVKRDSLDQVYDAFQNSPLPIALAPEAQITYHNYRVADTQRGTAHLACEAAVARIGTTSTVSIVPIGLEYRYPDDSDRKLRNIMRSIDRRLGITTPIPSSSSGLVDTLWDRYDRAIATIENRYRISDEVSLKDGGTVQARVDALNARLQRIIAHALESGERLLGINNDGEIDTISRVFRLRRNYWNARFPQPGSSPFENDLLDLESTEARVGARHFQIVDLIAYLDFAYLAEVGLTPGAPLPPAGSAHHARFVEYLLSLDDLLGRAMGHTVGSRRGWSGRTCSVVFGKPIAVEAPVERTHRSEYISQLQQTIEESLILLSDRE